MFILQLLYVLTVLYIIFATVALFMMLNNPFKFRDINYTIPFGKDTQNLRKKTLKDPKVRYWICNNPQDALKKNWVILLHPWGRNSKRMITRAEVYWEKGFSLIFLDARSHGQSSWAKTSKAFDFYSDTRRIVEIENIDTPIVHGLSFGSIATSFYAYKHETRAVILEALPSNFRDMFDDFLATLKFPKVLFGWIPTLIMKWDFPWDEFSPVNTLKKIESPIFLVHGEKDAMFSLERHFNLNLQSMSKNSKNQSWIVPGSLHSKMAMHFDYKERLSSFIDTIHNAD